MSKFEISKVYMLSVCKDIVIRKFEFEAKTQFILRKISQGVHALWSDKQTNSDYYFIFID